MEEVRARQKEFEARETKEQNLTTSLEDEVERKANERMCRSRPKEWMRSTS